MIWWHDSGSLDTWLQITIYSAHVRSHLGVPLLCLLTGDLGIQLWTQLCTLCSSHFLSSASCWGIDFDSNYSLAFKYQYFFLLLSNHFAISVNRLMVYRDYSTCWEKDRESGFLVLYFCLYIYFELKQMKNFMSIRNCIYGWIKLILCV